MLTRTCALCSVDFGFDVLCFYANLIVLKDCGRDMALVLKLNLGANIVASSVEMTGLLYYLYQSIMKGKVYRDDVLNKEFTALTNSDGAKQNSGE